MRYPLTAMLFACTLFTACEQKTKTNPVIVTSSYVDSGNYFLNNLNMLQLTLQPDTQHFHIKAAKRQTLLAANGLRITVEPQKLETVSGNKVTGDIDVSIIEATKQSDFVSYDIPTISGGQILESGGSYFISMRSGNEELKIKNGEALSIEIPKRSGKKMELFYGEKDSAGNFNWAEAGTIINMKGTDTSGFQDSVVRWQTVIKRFRIGG